MLFAMYVVAQTSVGVGGVDAHRVPYYSRSITCRGSKRKTVEIRFRVSQPVGLKSFEAECVKGTRKLQPHYYRVWNLLGVYYRSSEDLSTRSSGRRVSVRAQVPGDVSLVTAETVREEESKFGSSGFVDAAEVGGEDVVALGYGWKVREAIRFDTEELRAVAHVQASSFHLQAAVFDDLFFKIFKVISLNLNFS